MSAAVLMGITEHARMGMVRDRIEQHGICRDFSGLTPTELDTHARCITKVVVDAWERPLPYARRPKWADPDLPGDLLKGI